MKNENKLDEMVEILDDKHKYVPYKALDATTTVPDHQSDIQVTVCHRNLHKILFGGDQLTVARVRGAQGMREGSQNAIGRLEGVIPVAEDWHTKLCLIEVRMNSFLEYFKVHNTNFFR